jgi:hypothetical protein
LNQRTTCTNCNSQIANHKTTKRIADDKASLNVLQNTMLILPIAMQGTALHNVCNNQQQQSSLSVYHAKNPADNACRVSAKKHKN